MQMARDIFIFRYFSQGVNSIRDHASSLLVLRNCFRGDDLFDLKEFEHLQ